MMMIQVYRAMIQRHCATCSTCHGFSPVSVHLFECLRLGRMTTHFPAVGSRCVQSPALHRNLTVLSYQMLWISQLALWSPTWVGTS